MFYFLVLIFNILLLFLTSMLFSNRAFNFVDALLCNCFEHQYVAILIPYIDVNKHIFNHREIDCFRFVISMS